MATWAITKNIDHQQTIASLPDWELLLWYYPPSITALLVNLGNTTYAALKNKLLYLTLSYQAFMMKEKEMQ